MALFESTFPPYVPFGSRKLELGAIGSDVAVLQSIVNVLGRVIEAPTDLVSDPVAITGAFGAPTRAAVAGIQGYFDLVVDGAVGPATLSALGQGVGPDAPYGGPAYGSRPLVVGMSGGDVAVLQNRVSLLGYASRIGHAADGIFDQATRAAVLAFETDAAGSGYAGLACDGAVGSAVYDATWLSTLAGGRDLVPGCRGVDVACVQARLQSLGIYVGPIDGWYGRPLARAITTFQRGAGLRPDGVAGAEAFYTLGLRVPPWPMDPLVPAWPAEIAPRQAPTDRDASSRSRPLGEHARGRANGPWPVARYLGGPCYHGKPLTRTEAASVVAAGHRLVSLYSGANAVAAFRCGVQDDVHGSIDGQNAAALAADLGQPRGTSIYLDLVDNQTSPHSMWVAYVLAWMAAVEAAGYVPGVFSSPEQLDTIRSFVGPIASP